MQRKSLTILVFVLAALTLILAFDKTVADSKDAKFSKPTKVAVVNTRYILQKAKQYEVFMTNMQNESKKISEELQALADEMKKEEQALDTRVKGSADYLEMAQKLMEKEASVQAKKEFQQNLMTLKEKQWTETMYEKINQKISEVAKANDITIVLDGNSDLSREIPAISPKELVLTIRTRKVLYFADSVDLTDEVLAAVDAD